MNKLYLGNLLFDSIIGTLNNTTGSYKGISHKKYLAKYYSKVILVKEFTKQNDVDDDVFKDIRTDFKSGVTLKLGKNTDNVLRFLLSVYMQKPQFLSPSVLPGRVKNNKFVFNVLTDLFDYLTSPSLSKNNIYVPNDYYYEKNYINLMLKSNSLVRISDLFALDYFNTLRRKLMAYKLLLKHDSKYKFFRIKRIWHFADSYDPVFLLIKIKYNNSFSDKIFIAEMKKMMPHKDVVSREVYLITQLSSYEGVLRPSKDTFSDHIPYIPDIDKARKELKSAIIENEMAYDGGELTQKMREHYKEIEFCTIKSLLKDDPDVKFDGTTVKIIK